MELVDAAIEGLVVRTSPGSTDPWTLSVGAQPLAAFTGAAREGKSEQ